jgi:polyhydroxyalkanoate synthesis regulator phasin
MAEEEKEESGVFDRGMSEGFREALEGAFEATGKTRERAQDLTDRVVDEVTRLGQDARGAIAGLGVTGGESLEALEERVRRLEERLAELERETTGNDESG